MTSDNGNFSHEHPVSYSIRNSEILPSIFLKGCQTLMLKKT